MARVEVRDLDAPYGAEVLGWDPSSVTDSATVALLRRAYDERGLVVFRDATLTFEEQYAIVDTLERIEEPSMEDDRANANGNLVSNREPTAISRTGRLSFHTDAMWSDDPFRLVSLYAVEVAPGAPATRFASMEHAWRTLPDALRERVEGLHAIQGEGQYIETEESRQAFASNPAQANRSTVTPIGYRHPRTGRIVLYVSQQQTRAVVELPAAESDALLQDLFDHLYHADDVLEHHWRDGDLVAWDNLAVQHGRGDVLLDGPARTLRRAVIPAPWRWSVVYDVRPAPSDA